MNGSEQRVSSLPVLLRLGMLVCLCAACFALGAVWQARRNGSGKPDARGDDGPAKSDHDSAMVATSIRAEYNPQSALLIGANELVTVHQRTFKELVAAAWERIPIIGIVDNDDELELARDLLSEARLPAHAVHFIKHPLDSMWLRDYGPMFARLSDGRVIVVDAEYLNTGENGDRVLDNAFPSFIARKLRLPLHSMALTVEGGNVLHNGDGILATSTRLIKQNEPRQYSMEQIGHILRESFGSRCWVYLRPLEGEPTGHADYFMCFLRRNLALVGAYEKSYDAENAAILDDVAGTLTGQPTTMGPMFVERIPMPPRSSTGAWRSYCNVLFVNGLVLMPSFSNVDPAIERQAKETFERLMPDWKVMLVNSDSLAEKRGVLHCIGIGIPGFIDVKPLLDAAE